MLITEIRLRFQVTQDHGLHLRLATRFARLASLFESEVIVSSRERLANGKSSLDLLSLAASRGDMGGLARGLVLATLLRVGLSLDTGVSAQTSKAKEAPREHTKPVDVFNHIEGEVTAPQLGPAGTVVRKGEMVVEFDSEHLRDALTRQGMSVKSLDAAYRAAVMKREAAQIGVREFVYGISKEDLARAVLTFTIARCLSALRGFGRCRRTSSQSQRPTSV